MCTRQFPLFRNRRMTASHQYGCRNFRQANSVSRRAILKFGALGGLALPHLWQSESLAVSGNAVSGFGRAKRCIFLFMWGGPSQLDTFDMKPDAPSEIRGEFRPRATKTPGLMMCEHFQRLATMTDRVAIVRSLNHDDPAHLSSGHTTVTGQLPPVNKSDAEPPSAQGFTPLWLRDVAPSSGRVVVTLICDATLEGSASCSSWRCGSRTAWRLAGPTIQSIHRGR